MNTTRTGATDRLEIVRRRCFRGDRPHRFRAAVCFGADTAPLPPDRNCYYVKEKYIRGRRGPSAPALKHTELLLYSTDVNTTAMSSFAASETTADLGLPVTSSSGTSIRVSCRITQKTRVPWRVTTGSTHTRCFHPNPRLPLWRTAHGPEKRRLGGQVLACPHVGQRTGQSGHGERN